MSDVILIVTAGTTDLQVVMTPDGQTPQRSFPGDVLTFHQGLLRGDPPWVIDDSSETLALLEYRDRSQIAPLSTDLVLDEHGRVRLVPAKLAGIVAALEAHGDSVRGALVLANRRDAPRLNEPSAVGPVLAAWLAARDAQAPCTSADLTIDRPLGAEGPPFSWFNFMTEGNLEGTEEEERPVRRAIAHGIARAIRAVADASWSAGCKFVVATAGGFPELKPVVLEATRVAVGTARLWVATDPQGGSGPALVPAGDRLPAADNLRLRVRIDEALARYDFVHASELTDLVWRDPREHSWAIAVRQLGLLMKGSPVSAPHPLIAALPHQRVFFAALRAESALQNERLHEAIIATVSLGDVAILDAIEKLAWVERVDETRKVIFVHPTKAVPAAPLTQEGKPIWWRDGPRSLAYNSTKEALEKWPALCDAATASAVAALWMALRSGRLQKPSDYRNAAIHGRLAGPDLERGANAFEDARLWERGRSYSALDAAIVANTLEALGIGDPKQQIETLVAALRAAVRKV